MIMLAFCRWRLVSRGVLASQLIILVHRTGPMIIRKLHIPCQILEVHLRVDVGLGYVILLLQESMLVMCPLQALVPCRLAVPIIPHRPYECLYASFISLVGPDPEGHIIPRFYEQILPCRQGVSLFLLVELEPF